MDAIFSIMNFISQNSATVADLATLVALIYAIFQFHSWKKQKRAEKLAELSMELLSGASDLKNCILQIRYSPDEFEPSFGDAIYLKKSRYLDGLKSFEIVSSALTFIEILISSKDAQIKDEIKNICERLKDTYLNCGLAIADFDRLKKINPNCLDLPFKRFRLDLRSIESTEIQDSLSANMKLLFADIQDSEMIELKDSVDKLKELLSSFLRYQIK